MSGETSQKLAELNNEREVTDNQRYQKNKHRTNARLDPSVSARGVKIENSETSSKNLDNWSFQFWSRGQNWSFEFWSRGQNLTIGVLSFGQGGKIGVLSFGLGVRI